MTLRLHPPPIRDNLKSHSIPSPIPKPSTWPPQHRNTAPFNTHPQTIPQLSFNHFLRDQFSRNQNEGDSGVQEGIALCNVRFVCVAGKHTERTGWEHTQWNSGTRSPSRTTTSFP